MAEAVRRAGLHVRASAQQPGLRGVLRTQLEPQGVTKVASSDALPCPPGPPVGEGLTDRRWVSPLWSAEVPSACATAGEGLSLAAATGPLLVLASSENC